MWINSVVQKETWVRQKTDFLCWLQMEFGCVDLAQYVMEVVATKCPSVHDKLAVLTYVFSLLARWRWKETGPISVVEASHQW